MTALPLFFLFSSVCLSAAAATVPNYKPSENVITCHSGAGCSTQYIDGRNYRILKVPGLVLMVSVSSFGDYTRTDVSVMNNSHKHLEVSPGDFRLQVLTNPESPREARTVLSLSPEASLHTTTDGSNQGHRTSRLPPPTQIVIADRTLAPNEGMQGRLLFATGKKNRLVKMVLPLGGVWYEFPYAVQ